MPAQRLAGSLGEADRAGGDLVAVEPSRQTEPGGAPGTDGWLAEKLAIETEVDPRLPREGENHLPVGHFSEELGGPSNPEQLALLVARRAEAAQLAGAGDQDVVPAPGAVAKKGWSDPAARSGFALQRADEGQVNPNPARS